MHVCVIFNVLLCSGVSRSVPLGISCIGVGDGPFPLMRSFDDRLTARAFDNFQFVSLLDTQMEALRLYDEGQRDGSPFSEQYTPRSSQGSGKRDKKTMDRLKNTTLALHALMEIPAQYDSMKKLGLVDVSKEGWRKRSMAVEGFDSMPNSAGVRTPTK